MEQQIIQVIEQLKNIVNAVENLSASIPFWSLIVSIITLIVLVLYTWYTYKIAEATKENLSNELRPIVSCILKSGKNYYTKDQIKENPEKLYDTRCIVKNHSKYNIEVLTNLNLKLDGKLEKISNTYAGEKSWGLTSFQEINGHFPGDNSQLLKLKQKFKEAKCITIELEVSYNDFQSINKRYKNPIQYWHFDNDDKVWKNDIGLTV